MTYRIWDVEVFLSNEPEPKIFYSVHYYSIGGKRTQCYIFCVGVSVFDQRDMTIAVENNYEEAIWPL